MRTILTLVGYNQITASPCFTFISKTGVKLSLKKGSFYCTWIINVKGGIFVKIASYHSSKIRAGQEVQHLTKLFLFRKGPFSYFCYSNFLRRQFQPFGSTIRHPIERNDSGKRQEASNPTQPITKPLATKTKVTCASLRCRSARLSPSLMPLTSRRT